MAASKPDLEIFSSRSADFEKLVRAHHVGGFYLTQEEYRLCKDALRKRRPSKELPCRVSNVMCYFVEPETLVKYAEHVVVRASFGLTRNDLDWMKYSFEQSEDEDHPGKQFLKKLVRECEVKDETFIKNNCFSYEHCIEHDFCRRLHKYGVVTIRTGCCDSKNCPSPFNSYNQAGTEVFDGKPLFLKIAKTT